MKTATAIARKRSAFPSYFSLFTSMSTLFCCALPSLLVLFGLGSSVASVLSFMPWLVTLSRHKPWTFSVSGVLIALSFVNVYYVAPRLQPAECSPDHADACVEASRFSKVVLWVAAAIYLGGVFVAYALGPILTKLDIG
jgi:mercuric ion transport protein